MYLFTALSGLPPFLRLWFMRLFCVSLYFLVYVDVSVCLPAVSVFVCFLFYLFPVLLFFVSVFAYCCWFCSCLCLFFFFCSVSFLLFVFVSHFVSVCLFLFLLLCLIPLVCVCFSLHCCCCCLCVPSLYRDGLCGATLTLSLSHRFVFTRGVRQPSLSCLFVLQ